MSVFKSFYNVLANWKTDFQLGLSDESIYSLQEKIQSRLGYQEFSAKNTFEVRKIVWFIKLYLNCFYIFTYYLYIFILIKIYVTTYNSLLNIQKWVTTVNLFFSINSMYIFMSIDLQNRLSWNDNCYFLTDNVCHKRKHTFSIAPLHYCKMDHVH